MPHHWKREAALRSTRRQELKAQPRKRTAEEIARSDAAGVYGLSSGGKVTVIGGIDDHERQRAERWPN